MGGAGWPHIVAVRSSAAHVYTCEESNRFCHSDCRWPIATRLQRAVQPAHHKVFACLTGDRLLISQPPSASPGLFLLQYGACNCSAGNVGGGGGSGRLCFARHVYSRVSPQRRPISVVLRSIYGNNRRNEEHGFRLALLEYNYFYLASTQHTGQIKGVSRNHHVP